MALTIYDTKAGRKRPFSPRDDGVVRMYVCGPTTYDLSHIGHARSYVAFDVVRRYLEFLGYRVDHVQNFTDVEEVITKRAASKGMDPLAYAETYIRAYLEDMDALRVRRATRYARVSEHIPDILRIVGDLVDRGYAYESDGDIYFRTRRTTGSFGILSHQRFEDIVTDPVPAGGVREDPLDFAIWKRSKPGEPAWETPWGRGRPGWHVECFAMASRFLGTSIDIHGGGVDLKFPHHESEAMLCEAATGDEWTRFWMHNGFITLEREKMSKSLGNFITIREVLASYPPEVVRLCLLKSHYREDVEYDKDCFELAQREYDRIVGCRETARRANGPGTGGKAAAVVTHARESFRKAMDDDFDTNGAAYEMLKLVEAIEELEGMSREEGSEIDALFAVFGRILGLFEEGGS